MAGILSRLNITEIENQYNMVYRGFVPDPNAAEEYRGQEHTNVKAGWYDGWLYANGSLVVPFSAGYEVFDPVFAAASPEALDDLLQGGDVAFEK